MVEEQVCTLAPELSRTELQLDVISDPAVFDSIGKEWDRLVKRSGIGHLFLSHTWLSTWWEMFGEGKQLHIITVRADGDLIAAAPMMITAARMFGLQIRRIESIYNHHTPRFDFIIADRREAVNRVLWKELSQPKLDCDVILLAQIPDESPTLGQIENLATADEWLTGQWAAPPSPFIKLGCTYERLFSSLKGGYRYNLRKRYERLLKTGPIDIDVITEKSAVRDAMQDGLRIEAAAWKGEEGTAMVSDPKVAEFYTRFAERAADKGLLALTFLRVNGRRIAFDYIVRSDRTLCGVKIGYDPEYHTYSPGNMLLNLIIQEACRKGIAEYDFLGVDDEWKFDWTKETRGHRWLFLFRNTPKARLLYYMKFTVVPKLKKNRELVRLRDTIYKLPSYFRRGWGR